MFLALQSLLPTTCPTARRALLATDDQGNPGSNPRPKGEWGSSPPLSYAKSYAKPLKIRPNVRFKACVKGGYRRRIPRVEKLGRPKFSDGTRTSLSQPLKPATRHVVSRKTRIPYSTVRSMRERSAITRGERTRRLTSQRLNVDPLPPKSSRFWHFKTTGPPDNDH